MGTALAYFAIAGTALTRHLGILARHGTRVTAVVLIATGAYLAWYWLPAATGHTASGGNLLTGWSATATGWLQDHALPASVIAAFAVVVSAVAAYWTTHRRPITGKQRRR